MNDITARIRAVHRAATLILVVSLCGCNAVHVAVSKGRLDVQTKVSDALFPELPSYSGGYTFYVDIRNSTDKPGLGTVQGRVRELLLAQGYQETQRPDDAHYVIQGEILFSGRDAPTAYEKDKQGAYLDKVTGGIGAGMAGAETMQESPFAAGLALTVLGGAFSTAVDSAVKDITFTLITEVQLTERTDSVADEQTKHTFKQGTSGETKISFGENRKRKRARTRIVSTANKVNLLWDEAEAPLKEALAQAIAGIPPVRHSDLPDTPAAETDNIAATPVAAENGLPPQAARTEQDDGSQTDFTVFDPPASVHAAANEDAPNVTPLPMPTELLLDPAFPPAGGRAAGYGKRDKESTSKVARRHAKHTKRRKSGKRRKK